MALRKSIETDMGFVAEDGYIRINSINGDKYNLVIEVYFFYNQAYATDNYAPFNSSRYFFTPDIKDDAKNFYKQGYEYLKTLPEFKDAIDVLEEGQTAL